MCAKREMKKIGEEWENGENENGKVEKVEKKNVNAKLK